jgi:hypothetical protein
LATVPMMRARADRTRETCSENMSWDKHCTKCYGFGVLFIAFWGCY